MQPKNRKIGIIAGLIVTVLLGAYGIHQLVFPGLLFGSPLKVTLEVPQSITVGEQATFKLRVENASRRSLKKELGGDASHAFIISDKSGKELWTSREVYNPVLEIKTFSPKEEIILETTLTQYMWNPPPNSTPSIPIPSTPGTYVIQGALYGGQGDVTLWSPEQEIEIH